MTHITTSTTDSIFNALGPSRFIKKEKEKNKRVIGSKNFLLLGGEEETTERHEDRWS